MNRSVENTLENHSLPVAARLEGVWHERDVVIAIDWLVARQRRR
jgi:hypothetical protein